MAATKPKPTMKQLMTRIEAIEDAVNNWIQALAGELDKHNTVITKMLEVQGLMKVIDCPHCNGTMRVPILPDIDAPDDCSYCGKPIDDGQQTLPLEEE